MPAHTDVYQSLQNEVSTAGAHLVAVSKTRPLADIMALYELGHRDFGENRVSELVEKHAALPKDIRWHFIGHLQRNKVKEIISFVHLVHAVDSLRLLREIDKRAAEAGRTVSVLLQYHIADEESKYGLSPATAGELLDALRSEPLTNTTIAGVMGMATYTENETQVSAEFATLAELAHQLKINYFKGNHDFREISMGMSGDYRIALAHGSTLVRVGSMLFE